MRNTVIFLSCLLASLWISIVVRADNGVERGLIDYTSQTQIPNPVKLHLERVMFAQCDLQGASLITTNYLQSFTEVNDLGIPATSYLIEFQVSYKNSAELGRISAEVIFFETLAGEERVQLRKLSSPLCNN
jgi:hypothetical protein